MVSNKMKHKSKNEGIKNDGYIDGRTLGNFYCIKCGNYVGTYKTKLCQKCYCQISKGKGIPCMKKELNKIGVI